jgi:hypothetical protein
VPILAVDIAETQLGIKEATGQNDGIPAERYVRGEKLPWCASFVLYCNAQSDEEPCARTNAEWFEMRAVANFEAEMIKRGWWIPPTSTPRRGDLVFFGSRGSSDQSLSGRHMGMVERLDSHLLQTIEGNVGNRVSRLVHDLSQFSVRARVTGFARIPLRV